MSRFVLDCFWNLLSEGFMHCRTLHWLSTVDSLYQEKNFDWQLPMPCYGFVYTKCTRNVFHWCVEFCTNLSKELTKAVWLVWFILVFTLISFRKHALLKRPLCRCWCYFLVMSVEVIWVPLSPFLLSNQVRTCEWRRLLMSWLRFCIFILL